MKYLCILLCFVGLVANGATVTGNVQTVTSSPYDDDNILFLPRSTPWANGNNIVQSVTVRSASSNLAFSASLLGGVYLTKFTSGDQIYIYVPINDTNTYSFTFLSTNLLTMALINNPRTISSQVLPSTGIAIATNNAGTSSETISLTATPVTALGTNAFGTGSLLTNTPNYAVNNQNVAVLSTGGVSPITSANGYVGAIYVANSNILVTDLARWVIGTETGTHNLAIWDCSAYNNANIGDLTHQLGTVTINPVGAPAGNYLYGTLLSPVYIPAGHAFVVASQENNGDQYSQVTSINTVSDVTPAFGTYQGLGNGLCGGFAGWPGLSFGPLNFKFTRINPQPSISTVAGNTLVTNFTAADVQPQLQPTPMRSTEPYLDYFPDLLSANAETNMLLWIAQIATNGMKPFWPYVGFTDGIWTNRDVYGNLVAKTNRLPHGIKYICDIAHTNGLKINSYMQVVTNTQVTSRSPNVELRYAYQDGLTFASNGINAVFFATDVPFQNPGFVSSVTIPAIRLVNQGAYDYWQYYPNSNSVSFQSIIPGMVINAGINYDNATNGTFAFNEVVPPELFLQAGGIMGWGGASSNGVIADFGISNNIPLLDTVKPFLPYVRKGHFFNIESVIASYYQGGTNELKSLFEFCVELDAGCYLPPTWFRSDIVAASATMYWLTNAEFYGLWDDKACVPGSEIYSNWQARVWQRPLGNGSSNVWMAVNGYSTNFPFVLTNPTSYQIQVRDPWQQTVVATTNGNVTITVPPNSTRMVWWRPAIPVWEKDFQVSQDMIFPSSTGVGLNTEASPYFFDTCIRLASAATPGVEYFVPNTSYDLLPFSNVIWTATVFCESGTNTTLTVRPRSDSAASGGIRNLVVQATAAVTCTNFLLHTLVYTNNWPDSTSIRQAVATFYGPGGVGNNLTNNFDILNLHAQSLELR